MSLVIASGYFDPLHVGHIEYLEQAARLGDFLAVIVNNDKQCAAKKGKPFMSASDRRRIIACLDMVNFTYEAIDEDGSVCETIKQIADAWSGFGIIFAKGGDRFASEIPERAVCEQLRIELVDGLGEKIRSSSDLIKRSGI